MRSNAGYFTAQDASFIYENIQIDFEACKPIKQLVKEQGLKFESHEVTTVDGYVLELHRIVNPIIQIATTKTPNLLKKEQKLKSPVILLQHGMLSSSECFIINGKNSLAIKLAKMGYDIWLGNNRGNIYSRKHLWLNPDGSPEEKRQFFDYSFVEMG
jgi:methionine aminopeptidase